MQPAATATPAQTQAEVASAVLVSDIHLSDDLPQLTDRFMGWLETSLLGEHRPAALFILGDLFDAWVGDDLLQQADSSSAAQQVIATLGACRASGLQIFVGHGNRDFLLGADFAQACGAVLISDPFLLKISQGPRILLTHGDELCTRDLAYQAFRRQVRTPDWQRDFLNQPLRDRLATARSLRAQSDQEKSAKAFEIMDVTPHEASLLTDRCSADLLIHGHTHRPGCSVMANGKHRWVLPDWSVQAPARGGGLWADAQGIRPLTL